MEMAVNLPHNDEPGSPLFAGPGRPSPEVAAIAALLRRLEDGKQQLQHAASQLLIAGVLTPIRLGRNPGGENGRSFTVSRDQFNTLSGTRTALLAKDNFLAIDLAAACIFSQRNLATLVSVAPAATADASAAVPPGADEFVTPVRLNVEVDDQTLFSYEQYQGRAS